MKPMQFVHRRALVADCPLFRGRAFQYGPACAVAEGLHDRCLVYYPLGAGKTLAALHAAHTFLDMHPDGHIIVITTKSNRHTTWPDNIELYLQHVPDINGRIRMANIYNPDWWFSQSNELAAHYNQLIYLLMQKEELNRMHLVDSPPRTLKMYARQYGLKDAYKTFRAHLTETQRRLKQNMLQATVPPFPYMLIVDECQEYINTSAQSLLIRALARGAVNTLLLTATPLNDASQYGRLLRLLGTRDLSRSVVWSDESAEKPALDDRGIRRVELSEDEWREHQLKAKRDDAYYTKTRQVCNGPSKWSAMANSIESEILGRVGTPIRIVVYSFFLAHGVEGFYRYLAERYGGTMDTHKRLRYKVHNVRVKVSTMADDTLEWFNRPTAGCKILLLTSKSGKGISLKNVYSFHLMEPQWSSADEEQAIGRCTRKGSHDKIEPLVRVTRWVATAPRGRTADQRVHASMLDKKRRTDVVLDRIAEAGRRRLAQLLHDFRIMERTR